MKDDTTLDFSFGRLFPPNMHYVGYFILAMSVVAIGKGSYIVSIILIVGGAWLAFRSSGVQVRPGIKQYREYTRFLFKKGKWKSYVGYTDMALMSGREGYTAYSRGMVELNDYSDHVYDIYLLTPDHRSRLVLTRCTDKIEAEKKGLSLAEKLGLKWTIFSARVSAKTKLRKK